MTMDYRQDEIRNQEAIRKKQIEEEQEFRRRYDEMISQRRRKDIEAYNRRTKLIADNEAARVARGEPKQPPYVFPPDWEAYRARARVLMARMPGKNWI
jgi:hypothetical protein